MGVRRRRDPRTNSRAAVLCALFATAVVALPACASTGAGGATGGGDTAVRSAYRAALAEHLAGQHRAAVRRLSPLVRARPADVRLRVLAQDAQRAAVTILGGPPPMPHDPRTWSSEARQAASRPEAFVDALLRTRDRRTRGGAGVLRRYRDLAGPWTESRPGTGGAPVEPAADDPVAALRPWAWAALAEELVRAAASADRRAQERRDAGFAGEAEEAAGEAADLRTKALHWARRATTTAPGNAAGWEALAAALEAGAASSSIDTEGLKQAADAQRRALALSEGDARVAARLARLERRARNDQAAFEALEAALEWDPGDPVLLANAGRVALALGEFDDALSLLQQAAEQRTTDGELMHDVGVARQRVGDLAGAVEAFEAAVALLPGDRRPLESLALVEAERARRDSE